jgi:DNA polymerase-4
VLVPTGTEQALLAPLAVEVLPGVGPATRTRLRRLGVHTVAELAALPVAELVRELGRAHGESLAAMAHAVDSRPVSPERETKSVSVEDTFETDLVDPALLTAITERMAGRVVDRLQAARLSGRTVTLKVRLGDFTTSTRALSLPAPTDNHRVVTALAVRLLRESDTTGGVRLLGVGVSGLADWIQDDLFDGSLTGVAAPLGDVMPATDGQPPAGAEPAVMDPPSQPRWAPAPGADVVHQQHGRGWVWGSGHGRITVRFETARTGPGPVRTFSMDDPALRPAASDDLGQEH